MANSNQGQRLTNTTNSNDRSKDQKFEKLQHTLDQHTQLLNNQNQLLRGINQTLNNLKQRVQALEPQGGQPNPRRPSAPRQAGVATNVVMPKTSDQIYRMEESVLDKVIKAGGGDDAIIAYGSDLEKRREVGRVSKVTYIEPIAYDCLA